MENNLIKNEGENYISSRVLAKKLSKEHSHILRDIREKIGNPNLDSEIKSSTYSNRGKAETEYLISFSKCILLLMTYNGFLEEKENIIKMFMDQKAPKPVSRKELALMVLEQEKELEEARALIELQAPQIEFYNSVANVDKWLTMDEVAKTLAIKGMGRNNLYKILKDKKILFSDNAPYQIYIERGYFKRITQTYKNKYKNGEEISFKTVVSGKGLQYIQKLLMKG